MQWQLYRGGGSDLKIEPTENPSDCRHYSVRSSIKIARAKNAALQAFYLLACRAVELMMR